MYTYEYRITSFLFQIIYYFAFLHTSMMTHNPTNHSSGTVERATAIMTPIHEVTQIRTTPLGKKELSVGISSIYQRISIDEPPPAYEANPSSTENADSLPNQASSTTEAAATTASVGVIEAPPPYCLVDPTKAHNTDHLPHYPHITPVEIIDLNTNHGNEYVKPNRFFLFFSFEYSSDICSLLAIVIKQQ